MEKPTVPKPQITYGKIIYWLCIIAAFICTIGPVLAISFPQSNVMNPHFLFYSIWKGNTPEEVWQELAGGFPGTHFWLDNLGRFDALIQLGLVIGCSCAFAALLGASISFLHEKPRQVGWAFVSIVIMVQIFLSALGM